MGMQPLIKCLEDNPSNPAKWPACVAKAKQQIEDEVIQCVKKEKTITKPVTFTAELVFNDDDCIADPCGSCTNASWLPGANLSFFGDKTCCSDFVSGCKNSEGPIIGPACILSLGHEPFCWKTLGNLS